MRQLVEKRVKTIMGKVIYDNISAPNISTLVRYIQLDEGHVCIVTRYFGTVLTLYHNKDFCIVTKF